MSCLRPALVVFTLCLLSCSASTQVKEKKAGQAKAVDSNQQAVLAAIKQRYSPYGSMRGNFTVKGKVDGQQVYYTGIIRSYTNKKKEAVLKVQLRDGFLGSNLFELIVEGDKVIQKDHLRERTSKSTLAEYRWVQIFGQVFPFKFFLPLLKGFAPEQIFSDQALVGSEKILFKGSYYDLSVKYKGDLITSLFYRSKLNKHITVITFLGQAKNSSKRYFPRELLVQQNNSEDYLRLKFSRVRIK